MLFMTIRALHILAGIWFTCGVAAYLLARLTMLKSDDPRSVHALVGMTSQARNFLIRPGSMLLLVFGLWTAYDESWPRFALHAIALLVILVPFIVLTVKGGRRIEAASAEAVRAGSMTPALSAALRDRQTVIGEVGIGVITLLFLILMIVKPS
jgi:Ca2+/Na+ antiporter